MDFEDHERLTVVLSKGKKKEKKYHICIQVIGVIGFGDLLLLLIVI
jgi:hypothetical protein